MEKMVVNFDEFSHQNVQIVESIFIPPTRKTIAIEEINPIGKI
jgi:hypothetical protein